MNTAAASAGTTGASLGFAIPANTVQTIAAEIEAHKDIPGLVYGRQAFFGVEVVDSPGTGGVNFGFGFGVNPVASSPNGTPGVVIAAVDPGSAAATAGLVTGDVITAADGQATASTSALSKAMEAKKPGQIMSLKLATQAGTETVKVRLGQGPID